MNPHPDKQREELQRMLALKRLETPPPRFFRGFSDKVIDGLSAPQPIVPRTVWQRLSLELESPLVLVCASGVVVCGLLGAGVILALHFGPARPTSRLPQDQIQWVVAPPPAIQPAADADQVEPAVPAVQRSGHLNQPVIIPADASLTPLKPDRQPATTETNGGSK